MYAVATVSRINTIIGLFCRQWSCLQGSFAKETYCLIDPTNRSHPIWSCIHLPSTYTNTKVHVSMSVSVSVSVSVFVYIYVYIYICTWTHWSIRIYEIVYTSYITQAYLSPHLDTYTCMKRYNNDPQSTYIHIYINIYYVHSYIYIYIYICIYIYIRIYHSYIRTCMNRRNNDP